MTCRLANECGQGGTAGSRPNIWPFTSAAQPLLAAAALPLTSHRHQSPSMHDRDCLHRFLFEHYPIRGHLVHLDASWRALLEHREYPEAIRDTLGEAVAASVLLAATLKFDGTLSLQLQWQGPVHLMLAQCSSELGVRAVARYREAVDQRDLSVLSGEGSRAQSSSPRGCGSMRRRRVSPECCCSACPLLRCASARAPLR